MPLTERLPGSDGSTRRIFNGGVMRSDEALRKAAGWPWAAAGKMADMEVSTLLKGFCESPAGLCRIGGLGLWEG